MAFQIKNFTSIVASMVNYMRGSQTKITDFRVGSAARTMLEAPAVEIEELYKQMFNGIISAIPVALYQSFNFSLLGPATAYNYVTVTIPVQTSATPIAAGASFGIPGISVTYTSQSAFSIPAGQTSVDVLVFASTTGSAGNCGAGEITSILSGVGVTGATVTNAAAFTNGYDQETDAQRQTRFQAFISSLSRGVVGALEYAATTAALTDANGNITERVEFAEVIEPYELDPTYLPGYIYLFIHNGTGSTSSQLLALATQIILGYYNGAMAVAGYKAAGVIVNVLTGTDTPVNVTAQLSVVDESQRATIVAAVSAAIASYLQLLPCGQTVTRAGLYATIMAVSGVTNVVLSLPAADVPMTFSQKPLPGTIAVS
jgi:phage-related baseplate assembly protein